MSTLSILLEKTLINLKKEVNDPKNTELIDSIIEPIIHKIIFGTDFILVRRCNDFRKSVHDVEKLYVSNIISLVSKVEAHKRR